MRTELIMTALEQAVWRRDTWLHELIAHSDAGSQYTSIRYTDRLAEIRARPSIGTVADAYDNAMAETTIGLYKTELVTPQRPWRTAEQLEIATLMYVEWFNNRRLHSELSYRTPAEHEQAYYRSNNNQLTTI
jgi:putative transposase